MLRLNNFLPHRKPYSFDFELKLTSQFAEFWLLFPVIACRSMIPSYRIENSVLRVTNIIVWNVYSVQTERFWFGCLGGAQACPKLCWWHHHPSWLQSMVPSYSQLFGISLEKMDKKKQLRFIRHKHHIDRRRTLCQHLSQMHDKTNKITLCQAKPTQICLNILPVWPVFALRVKKMWIQR